MDPERISFYITTAIFLTLYVVGTPLFIWRRNLEPIRSRGRIIAVLQMTYCLYYFIVHLPSGTPCLFNVINDLLSIPVWIYPYFVRSFKLWCHFNLQKMMLQEDVKSARFRRLSWIQRHPWILSERSQIVLFAVCIFLAVVTGVVVFYATGGATHSCGYEATNLAEFFGILGQSVISTTGILVAIVAMWNVEDAYLIKHELSTMLFCGIPALVLWALALVYNWAGGYGAHLWVNLLIIISICVTIWMPLIGTFFFDRAMRRSFKKIKPDDSSSIELNQDDEFKMVLNNEICLPVFEKFVVSAWAVENLMFYRRVERLRGLPQEQLTEQGNLLYKEFIESGSPFELNLDMSITKGIKTSLENGQHSIKTWESAEKQCLDLLRFSIFPLWKSSPGFKEMLKKNKANTLLELKAVQVNSLRSGDSKTHSERPLSSSDMEHF